MFPHVGLSYVKFLSVNIENYIYLDLHSYRLESFLKTANTAVINNSLTFHKRISKTIDLPFSVGSKNDSQFNNDHLPFCCQDAVGNFSETSRISVSHWTFRLDLCAFLANNFVRASEYAMLLSTVTLKSLTGIIIPFFVLFFRSKISHARWKISLQETTLLLTSGLSLTAGQRKNLFCGR